MKKRAQPPDAFTYTILLRGLATHVTYPQSLAKALSIYHSLFAPNTPVKPSIIHTNAVLKVCARANDLDSMWGIAARLPTSGKNAPDSFTFTTILNAIRQNASEHMGGQVNSEEQQRDRKEKAIREGRRIWDDIVGRWRKGEMSVDEDLVCAMGRLLLIGNRPRDWDDVLSLVEQTMNIPRLIPRLGSPQNTAAHLPSPESSEENQSESDRASTVTEPEASLLPGGEFDVLPVGRSVSGLNKSGAAALQYAKPAQNTLSLIMQVFVKLRLKSPASSYWSLLTGSDGYTIQPDAANYQDYLRHLRIMRAGNDTVELLRNEMPRDMLQERTFRIAMSTISRDRKNPKSFQNAGIVLDLMQQTLQDVDVRTLQTYLNIACYFLPDTHPNVKHDVPEDRQAGELILRALDRLESCVNNAYSCASYGSTRRDIVRYTNGETAGLDDFVKLCSSMVGIYDKLILQALVPQELHKMLKRKRAKLAFRVTNLSKRVRPEFRAGGDMKTQKTEPSI
jgi:hypothetical protein